ncbi:hypothetical protein POPTR_002G213900v4 [Populus trichocarpa]|uniref:Uncharacterized protein n=1 Tax=Populus trichocarpa TaxID=3694 RepID=A0ACC0TF85_POPTR|nr:uncharacterized protein LOC127904970 [Populus trichocarpa]KAI9400257.1 hypothetical protein POPTR_002G213900v4 [Populus trichocarpa]
MERMKKSVDVSSFLLVEATGDSEVDSDPNMTIIDLVDDDDGDAESCSCDTSYHSCVNGVYSEVEEYHVNYNVVDEEQHQHQHQQQEEEEEEEEEEQQQEKGVHVYQSRVDHGHAGLPVKQKSCVSVDSANESMNEKEENRLFWEACLAS